MGRFALLEAKRQSAARGFAPPLDCAPDGATLEANGGALLSSNGGALLSSNGALLSCLFLLLALLLPGAAFAAEEPAPAEPPALERYRTPFEVLTERMVGTASRAVRFDWRRKTVGVAVIGSQLLELNNFASARVGGSVRTPVLGGFMGELAITRVVTWGSASTQMLPPYTQVARPSRMELDLNLGWPLFEGVSTPRWSFLPPVELVLSLEGGLRYSYYPGALAGANFGEAFTNLFAVQLSERERGNLAPDRLNGMELDGARYNLLVGLNLDLYFQSGLFFTPRVMVALPVTGSRLGWWWELSGSAGWMF